MLWEASGNDPSPDDTSVPPTLITVTAKHFVSIIWQAASRLPAALEHPPSQLGPGQPPSAPLCDSRLLNLHLMLCGVGALTGPRGAALPVGLVQGTHAAVTWEGGCMSTWLRGGGQGTPASQHPRARLHPGEPRRGQ